MSLLFILIIFFISGNLFSYQTDSLKIKIESILNEKKADVGVAILGLEDDFNLSVNGNKHYPMQSVFKFHIAFCIMNMVDKGKLSLNKKILLKKEDLRINTWSPMREKYPNGDIKIPLSEILQFTVSKSDNNGCDILFKLAGGTEKVEKFIQSLCVQDISIKSTELEMKKDWNIQFTNWTTPNASALLLKIFFENKTLSKNSFNFLWNTLVETSTGPKRIKGQLPTGTIVAHKTGSSGENEEGITAGTNDIGIVALPNGKHFAIAVFVSNSKENEETNEKIISDIAKAVWDHFTN